MKEIVFLVILTLSNTGSDFRHNYHEMPNMIVCQDCVKNARIAVANGGDSESVVVMYCAKNKSKLLSLRSRLKGVE